MKMKTVLCEFIKLEEELTFECSAVISHVMADKHALSILHAADPGRVWVREWSPSRSDSSTRRKNGRRSEAAAAAERPLQEERNK